MDILASIVQYKEYIHKNKFFAMIPKNVVIKNFGKRYVGNGDEIFYSYIGVLKQ